MLKNIIHAKGGLHNRITASILLKPFNLHDTELYLKKRGINYDRRQLLDIYLVTGGVAHYLKSIIKGLSATQNINQQCFQSSGSLYDEFDVLFTSLFNNAEIVEELIKIIAQYRYGVDKIALLKKAKRSKSGGRFNERLIALEKAGFIASYSVPDHAAKHKFYRLIDEYCLFYLKWIKPAKNQLLSDDDNHYWEQISQTPSWRSWAGYAFESLCFKHIKQIRYALGIDYVAISAYCWRYLPNDKNDQGAQIDLVIERSDETITLVEIKLCGEPFVIQKSYAAIMLNKINAYKQQTKTKKHIFMAMVTPYGVKRNQYSNEIISNQVTLDDLFNK